MPIVGQIENPQRKNRVAKNHNKKQKSVVREYTEAIIIALVLALFIRTFVIQAFKIPSGSMLPTLQIGDHILVSKFIYGIKVPFTGTVLVPFKKPTTNDIIVFKYPEDPSLDFIKRVIGVPGDVIEIRNKKVYLNGKSFEDKYGTHLDARIIDSRNGPRDNFGPQTVPEDKFFVMGDNRDNSHDSRFWGFVDIQSVRGKAVVIYWSWNVLKPLFSVDRFKSVRWDRLGDLVH
jgi:signal peptidase I